MNCGREQRDRVAEPEPIPAAAAPVPASIDTHSDVQFPALSAAPPAPGLVLAHHRVYKGITTPTTLLLTSVTELVFKIQKKNCVHQLRCMTGVYTPRHRLLRFCTAIAHNLVGQGIGALTITTFMLLSAKKLVTHPHNFSGTLIAHLYYKKKKKENNNP